MRNLKKALLAMACMMVMMLGVSGVVNAAEAGSLKTGVTWRIEGDTLIFSGNGPMGEYNMDYDPAILDTCPPVERITKMSGHNVMKEIRKVVIEDGVTSIGQLTFDCFLSMEELVIPKSVKSIGYLALAGDVRLKKITFEGNQAEWNAISKYKNWNGIYDGVFENVASIKRTGSENGVKVTSVPKAFKEKSVVCTRTGLDCVAVIMQDGDVADLDLPAGTKATVKSKSSKIAKVKYNKKTGMILITAVNPGTTTVTVKVGKATETFEVVVKAAPFELSKNEVNLAVKGKDTVTVPKKTKATVKSADKSIATASYNKKKGEIKITGKKAGTTEINVQVGAEVKTIKVTVK